MGRLLLHAPGVHFGGGFILLKALILENDTENIWANLDGRISNLINLPSNLSYYFISPSYFERFKAEFRLFITSKNEDTTLCFNGLPPLFPVRGRVVVFLQNRNHLGLNALSEFSGQTRRRLRLQRIISRFFKGNVDEYIVQTPTMKRSVIQWHGNNPIVRVATFMDTKIFSAKNKVSAANKVFDFIYIADGEQHKNHSKLIAAWILLSKEGIFPSLVLTLPKKSLKEINEINICVSKHGLKIENFSNLSHSEVLDLLGKTSALVFPSKSESFGLPLIEAKLLNVPIIASELDYVRDVCQPLQTFDPDSPTSIVSAIKRFLNIPSDGLKIRTAVEFLREL